MSLHLTILLTLLIISSLVSTTTNFLPLPQQTMAQIEDEVEEEDSQTTTTITTGDLTTYENSTYGLRIQYPSDWSIDEVDPDPEDRATHVVTFWAPFETPQDTYQERVSLLIDNIPYRADLAEYLQESINAYKVNEDFEIVESNTDAKLAGNPAYLLTYTWTTEPENEDELSYNLQTMEIGTIIENKGYYITYNAEEDAYSDYLPTIQKMIDSLVIDASTSPIQQGLVSQSNASLQADQSEDFLQYDNADLGINIQFPSNWEQSESTTSNGDPSIGFVSPFESNTDKFPEMLWIAVESLDFTNVNIDDERNEVINTLKNDFPNFQLIESDTNSLLAGNPAYKFVFTYTEGVEFGNCRGVCDQKGMFMGTIIDNKEYRIEYYGEAAAYDSYLPIIERMIGSFKTSSAPEETGAPTSLDEQPVTQPTTDTVLLEDNFNSENDGAGTLNYNTFTNWDVIDGTVDLQGNGFYDVEQSNGLYVDLDGSTNDAGILESKTEFNLEPGDYILEFDLGNYHSDNVNTVKVQLGDVFMETFTMESESPFTHITKNIHVPGFTSAKLSFDNSGGDNLGIYLDNIKLSINNATVDISSTTTTATTNNFLTYVNSTYGVSMQYPSTDWEIYEQDLSPSDSVTDIVTFSSPIKSFVDSYPESVGIKIDNLQNTSITLDEYLDYTINSYKESYPYFNIIESTTDSILTSNNNSAYRLIYTTKNPEQNLELKVIETGTIIGDKAYYITYFAEEKRFSEYLPVVESMINSFKITNVPSINEKQQIEEQPKRVKYSLPEDNTQFITLSYDQWVSDDLNVMILINPDTQEQSSKYIKQVEDAINKWSELLKEYSGNDYAWNFNITKSVGYLSSIKPDQAVDITVAITGDPEGVACTDILGIAPPHPYNLALPVIVNVLTSCINESQEVIEFPPDVVYSTVLHEFAHSLGLGHAFNMNNDLMCSGEVDINGNPFNTCEYYEANVADISQHDINALLYKYGKDGFKLPNRDLKGEIPYYEVSIPIS